VNDLSANFYTNKAHARPTSDRLCAKSGMINLLWMLCRPTHSSVDFM